MSFGSMFCDYINPGLYEFLVPLLFLASFVAFMWGVFYYAIAGEYDEYSRDLAKALMLWSIIAFLFMVVIWALIGWIYGWLGISATVCG